MRRAALLLLVAAAARAGGEPLRLSAVWGAGGASPGLFKEPMGIAVDARGDVYVADSRGRRVLKLSGDGKVEAEIGGPADLRKPVDAAVAPDGTLYVCDFDADDVEAFSPEGRRLFAWGGPGEGAGQFRSPAGIAVDKGGRVFVADFYNSRVQVFDPRGRWLRIIGRKGRGGGEFTYPAGLAFDASGDLLVADAYNQRVQRLSPEGRVLATWGSSWRRLLGPSRSFHVPTGVAVDSAGSIFVADSANKRLVRLAPDGAFLGEWRAPDDRHPDVYSPTRVAAGPGGRVYVVDTANDRVLVLAPGAAGPAAGEMTVRVDGMACPFCAYGIEKHLSRLPGVRSARVNLGQGTAVLSLEPGATLSFAEVRTAVEKAGFKASELKAVEPGHP